MALLSKEERWRRFDEDDRVRYAFGEADRSLTDCEERRSIQRLPPSGIAWENRPKWDGEIINLTPVVGDPFVAQARE